MSIFRNRNSGPLVFHSLLAAILVFSVFSFTYADETTMERVLRTGEIRVNVMIGEAPGFIKDPKTGEWSGHFIDISKAIAEAFKAKLVPVETTWGTVAMDLQANKIDMAIGVNPTAARALVVDYTLHPIYYNSFSVISRPDLPADTWKELNKPEVKIGVEVGSSHDAIATRFAPDANIIRFRSRDESLLALESRRVDAIVNTVFNSLIAAKARPKLGKVTVPNPRALAPSAIATRREAGDKAWQQALSVIAWNLQSSGFSRAAILKHLATYGISASDLPKDLTI
jgi:polar amino acid transport system substrate-binding protein